MSFTLNALNIDPHAEVDQIVNGLRRQVRKDLRKQGAVVGISGGIDSSVVLALAARAFGPERVVAVMMPEKDSDPESERLARLLAARFSVIPILEDITPVLAGFGCYARRDAAVRRVFPEYDAAKGYRMKIVLPQSLLDGDMLNVFTLTVVTPNGEEVSLPLPAKEFLQIVAASNFKQRTRMSMLYYHAELNNYAVLGTANKNEHDQGFFVKYGDSGVDIKVLGHLYKTQVYQLAKFLCVPQEIQERTPTTDTYSAPCTQEEFFFRLPFRTMDLLWFAYEHDLPPNEVALEMGLKEVQVQRAFTDFSRKYRTTEYLRSSPLPVHAECGE